MRRFILLLPGETGRLPTKAASSARDNVPLPSASISLIMLLKCSSFLSWSPVNLIARVSSFASSAPDASSSTSMKIARSRASDIWLTDEEMLVSDTARMDERSVMVAAAVATDMAKAAVLSPRPGAERTQTEVQIHSQGYATVEPGEGDTFWLKDAQLCLQLRPVGGGGGTDEAYEWLSLLMQQTATAAGAATLPATGSGNMRMSESASV